MEPEEEEEEVREEEWTPVSERTSVSSVSLLMPWSRYCMYTIPSC